MDYNFAEFLKVSRRKCRTKEDFIVRISAEIDKTVEGHANPQCFRDKKSYLNRLEGARFAAITSQLKEPDKYNEEIMRVLNTLK